MLTCGMVSSTMPEKHKPVMKDIILEVLGGLLVMLLLMVFTVLCAAC